MMAPSPVNRPLAYTLFTLAAALVVNTVLGPAFNDRIRYRNDALTLLSPEVIEPLLSPSQRQVWDYLAGVDEAAPRDIAAGTGVLLPTVAHALTKLVALGHVERLGLGRATRYRQTDRQASGRAA